MRIITQTEAHSDYIRSIAVNTKKSLIISTSDDLKIKAWQIDNSLTPFETYEGHSHYVMQVAIDPNNENIFASASLDGTIKIWNIHSPSANFTLKGHNKGVNCVEFFPQAEKPFLVSGDDEAFVKVWNCRTKQCLATLSGHSSCISAVAIHPSLPLIISSSEDGCLRLWHSRSFRCEGALDYGLDRVWTICTKKDCFIAAGFDFGAVMLQIGDEDLPASMDQLGHAIWHDGLTLKSANISSAIKYMSSEDLLTDNGGAKGETVLEVEKEEILSNEILPEKISHSPNGRLISLVGGGQFAVNTSRKSKSVAFGRADDFAWSFDSKMHAVIENASIKFFFENKEVKRLAPSLGADKIFGGNFLSVRSKEALDLLDWATFEWKVQIPVFANLVEWSESGIFLAIAAQHRLMLVCHDETRANKPFSVIFALKEKATSLCFYKDVCLFYTTADKKLKAVLCAQDKNLRENWPICDLSARRKLLGIIPSLNKAVLISKDNSIAAVDIDLEMISLQTQLLRGETDRPADSQRIARIKADKNVSNGEKTRLAEFFRRINRSDLALQVAVEEEQIFSLALETGKDGISYEIAAKRNEKMYWKKLSEFYLKKGDFAKGKECAYKAPDFESLLLLGVALRDAKCLQKLREMAVSERNNNVAFWCSVYLADLRKAVELLCDEGRFSEAALLSRSYSLDSGPVLEAWNKSQKEREYLRAEDKSDLLRFG